MVGHDQYNAIPEGEQYPLWQGKQNKAWKPVLCERAYWSPDGQIQDTVGIFCTAANDKRGRYRKGRKWKTHDEMQDWYRLAAEARAAEPARRAAAAPFDPTERWLGSDESRFVSRTTEFKTQRNEAADGTREARRVPERM